MSHMDTEWKKKDWQQPIRFTQYFNKFLESYKSLWSYSSQVFDAIYRAMFNFMDI